MTAEVQAFMQAHPVSSAHSRAVRLDQLKAHIKDVARHFCSTLHAERTTQLRALKVRASIARAAYLTDPANQQAFTLALFSWSSFVSCIVGGQKQACFLFF